MFQPSPSTLKYTQQLAGHYGHMDTLSDIYAVVHRGEYVVIYHNTLAPSVDHIYTVKSNIRTPLANATKSDVLLNESEYTGLNEFLPA